MAILLQTILTSLVLGSLYALIALGYTMVFGVLKLINFAHSDIVTLGAWISVSMAVMGLPYLGISVVNAPWYTPVLLLGVAMGLCGVIGFLIERLAYRPLRKAPRLNALITAIGVSLLLQNVGQLQYTIHDNERVMVTGSATPRPPGVAATNVKLPAALTIEAGYTYQVRVRPAAGGNTTNAPANDAGGGSQDRAAVRKIVAEPGTTIGTDGYATIDGPIGNAQLRNASIEVLRVSDKPAIRLPFGAKPDSMPPGVVTRDDGSTVSVEHRDAVLASGKFVEWRPSPAVLMQLNFTRPAPQADRPPLYEPLKITTIDATIVGVAMILIALLQYLVFGTRVGTAMRAVSYNMDTAALMGIPVDRIVSVTFVAGTMLAAAAGFLYALKFTPIQQPAHTSWTLLGLKAFVAAVVGGIGNIRGAAVGGLLIAVIEQFSAYFGQLVGFDQISAYTDVIVFGLLIVVLLVKPTGLFGSPVREKV